MKRWLLLSALLVGCNKPTVPTARQLINAPVVPETPRDNFRAVPVGQSVRAAVSRSKEGHLWICEDCGFLKDGRGGHLVTRTQTGWKISLNPAIELKGDSTDAELTSYNNWLLVTEIEAESR